MPLRASADAERHELLDRDPERWFSVLRDAEEETQVQRPVRKEIGVEIDPNDRCVGAVEDHRGQQTIVIVPALFRFEHDVAQQRRAHAGCRLQR